VLVVCRDCFWASSSMAWLASGRYVVLRSYALSTGCEGYSLYEEIYPDTALNCCTCKCDLVATVCHNVCGSRAGQQ
jgi:hypothetical protein